MHELTVTRNILRIVLKHAERVNVRRILLVRLEIGALSDMQAEWIQRYFDRISRGTAAEGARLKVQRTPARFSCNACGQQFNLDSLPRDEITCTACRSRDVHLVSGREYRVRDMEVETDE